MKDKLYEQWWENNVGGSNYNHDGSLQKAPTCEEFESWMGDKDSVDRKFIRTLWGDFKTFLDGGCGACPEYFGLKSDFADEKAYTGVDVTPKLVEYNKGRGINCVHGSLNDIPFADDTFDVSLSRHVVEHMAGIEKPLSELIRVTKNQVILCFFIDPLKNISFSHNIKLDDAGTKSECYHNQYSSSLINIFLSNHPKVRSFDWIDGKGKLNPSKSVLRIST
jgi:ubiquinone/menaquinone biosynthesis C-methylase UbiE